MSQLDKIIIISLKADNINITQPPVVSLSPISVSQFLDALRHRVQKLAGDVIEDMELGAFLLGIKKFSSARGQVLGSGMKMTTKGKVDKHATSPKSPYLIRGSVDLVLIVDCEAEIEDEEHENVILKREVTNILHQMKFLGGHIVGLDVQVYDKSEFREVIAQKISRDPKLYFYRLRDDLLQRYVNEYGNPVRAVIESSCPVYQEEISVDKNEGNKGESNRRPAFRKEKGFLFLTTIGYQLLEKPKKRQNSRFSYPHAFAEPVFSLIELIAAPKAMPEGSREDFYWQKMYDKKSLSYCVYQ